MSRPVVTNAHLPSRCRKDMFVPLIITPLYDFPCMRLVLFPSGISQQSHVVVDIEVEERAGFATRLVDDEIIKSIMLDGELVTIHRGKLEGRT